MQNHQLPLRLEQMSLFFVLAILVVLLSSASTSSLLDSEIQALLQVRSMLETPTALQSWSQQTDFCNLPPSPSLTIVCEGGFITHLELVGDRASPSFLNKDATNSMLSSDFSSDSLMLELSTLTQLKVLHLSSLGLWGPLSSKLGRLSSLQVLNVSSNFFSGAIPNRLMLLRSLQILALDDNMLNGSLPQHWDSLQGLATLGLSNNKFSAQLPPAIFSLPNLKTLVLDNNLFVGSVPNSLSKAYGLQALSIAGNHLSGNLPDLSGLSNLLALNLQKNDIGPQFPFLSSQLLYLALGNNKLEGPIPTSIGNLTKVLQLDLSSNFLSGSPPLSFFALPSIQFLNVARNRLSGKLPSNLSLSNSLKLLDISFNLLTGHLPRQIISSSSEGISVKLQGNCFSTSLQPQNAVSYCQNGALASGINPRDSQNTSRRTHIALLAGISGGVLGLAVASIILLVIIVRRCKGGDSPKSLNGTCMDNKSVAVSSELLSNARYISQTMKLGALGLPQYRIFSLEDLQKATNHFNASALLGEGSRGKVFKGRLEDGSFVAIKCLTKDYTNRVKNLKLRLELLRKLRHQHLVSLLGHSLEYEDNALNGGPMFLVFEFVSSGTLRSRIAGKGQDGLGWLQRLLVIIGAAKGIHFLHSGLVPGIFDNDIKITSILLDQNLVAKVSDYGLLGRPDVEDTDAKAAAQRMNGHPQLDKSSRKKLVDKIDVYNFGLILLEIVLGRPPTIVYSSAGPKVEELDSLVGEQGPRLEMIDPKIVGVCTAESLGTVVEITTKCLSEDPVSRPSMEDVLWNLQYALQVQDSSNGEFQDEVPDGFFPEPIPGKEQGKDQRNIMMVGRASNEEVSGKIKYRRQFSYNRHSQYVPLKAVLQG